MTSAQYMRIERKAGGKGCTCRQFIKACHTFLSAKGKSREMRETRHQWIREGLERLNTPIF